MRLTFIILLLTCWVAKAFERDLYFDNLSLLNGLNQASVYSLAQDKYGFTWIGTQDGLHRFDGTNIEFIELSPITQPKYRYIRAINIFKERVFVSTSDGLVVVDLNNGNKLYPNVYDAKIFSVEQVNQDIWLGTSKGLFILNQDLSIQRIYSSSYEMKDTPISYSPCSQSQKSSYCGGLARKLTVDKTNNIVWIASYNGLFKYSLTTDTFEKIIVATSNKNMPINDLHLDHNNQLWIASEKGLFHFLLKQKKIQLINPINTTTITEDSSHYIWAGTRTGLYQIKNTESLPLKYQSKKYDHINFISENYNNSHSLLSNVIRSLHTDQQGRIWVGTDKGLSVTNSNRAKINTFRNNKATTDHNYILSITELISSKFLLGTRRGMLLFHEGKLKLIDSIPQDSFYDSLFDGKHIWASGKNGLYQIEPETYKVISHFNSANSPLPDAYIYNIKKNNSIIWLGTSKGLFKFDILSGKWTNWLSEHGLVNNLIYTLKLKENLLFIGTSQGMSIFNIKAEKFTSFTASNSQLLSNWIFGISHWKDSKYLVSTDGGVYSFNLNNRLFKYLGITNGNAYMALPKGNHIWVTSNNGLYKYDVNTKQSHVFKESHGLASNESNLNAAKITTGGELFIGTINGFTKTPFEQLTFPIEKPKKRYISNVSINNQYYSNWDVLPNSEIDNFSSLVHLEINWNTNNISLGLTNPSFALNRPVYQGENTINLDFLQSGTHTINLSSLPNNHIKVTKYSHPLLSIFAFIVYGLIFTLLSYFIVKFVITKKFNKALINKNIIISKQHQEIQSHLMFKENLYLQIQHSFKSPIFACLGLCKQIKKQLHADKIIDVNSIERKNIKLQNALEQVSLLTDELLDLSKLNFESVNYENLNVILQINKTLDIISPIAENENISIRYKNTLNPLDVDTIYGPKNTLFLILENLISNAIKYSPPYSEIEFTTERENNLLKIQVNDNGCGFTEADFNNIFQIFYRAKDNNKSGSGIGLSTVKDLLDKLDGSISLDNNIPCGTRINVTIPLKEKNGH